MAVVRRILEDFEPMPAAALAGATQLALDTSKEFQAARSSMGLFDFIGDAAEAAIGIVNKVVPGGVGGLVGGVLGGPIGGNIAVAAPSLFAGDLGGAFGAVLKANVQAGQAVLPLLGGGPATSAIFGGASGLFGSPAPGGGGLAGIISSVSKGDWTGAAGGVLGLLAPKKPAAAVAPPSLLNNAAWPTGPGPTMAAPRRIPALPTSIAIKEPTMASSLSIGGPYGINFSGGGGYSNVNTGNGITIAGARSALLQNASSNAGFRITWPKLLYMLLHFGIALVKQVTGLDESQILFLQMNRPHRGRRGPFLRTIEKRVRQADGYKRRVAKVARMLHVVGGGASRALPARRSYRRRSPRGRARR